MTATTYLEWEDQATGANNNTWGDVQDSNNTIFETAIARVLSLATTGGSTSLTTAQNRYPIILVTGVLISNATIIVRTAEKNWLFINQTTGAFTVTVKTSAGTGKTLPRQRAVKLYCDGINVEHAQPRGIPSAAAGGTVDAITATFEPAITVAELRDGDLFVVEAAGANTSTVPTFAPDTMTARVITKFGGQELLPGDIRGAGHKCLLMYDTTGPSYELLNPFGASLGANTFTGSQTLVSTDPGPAAGPLLTMYRDSASPAASDLVGQIIMSGEDSAGNTETYGSITGRIVDPTSTSEDGTISMATVIAGTMADRMMVGAGLFTPGATGGDMGVNTVNAAEYYRNGVRSDLWVHIATLTPTNVANINLTGLSGYRKLRIHIENMRSVTDDVRFLVRLSSDGINYLTSNYTQYLVGQDSVAPDATTAFSFEDVPSPGVDIGNAATDGGLFSTFELHNFNIAQKTGITGIFAFGDTAGNIGGGTTIGFHTAQTAMQAVRFLFNTGNIASGSIIIEGIPG